jgi:hypothetical protein
MDQANFEYSRRRYATDIEIWAGTVNLGASSSITIMLSGIPINGVGIAVICEYSGFIGGYNLDRTAAANGGFRSQTSTGTTANTNSANELIVGGINAGAESQTIPTNGFSMIGGTLYNAACSVAYLEKIVSAAGAFSSGTTATSTNWYTGCIATFTPTQTTPTPTPSPTPTVTPMPTPNPIPTPSSTPKPTATPTPTSSSTPSPSPTPTPSALIGIYSDTACTTALSAINFGQIAVGETKTITVYLHNQGNQGVTLSKSIANWNPATLSNYLTLTWDYSNQSVNPSATLAVKLSLTVAPNTPVTNSFGFSATITATSN